MYTESLKKNSIVECPECNNDVQNFNHNDSNLNNYADEIKKQDFKNMTDPLSYPYTRLPYEIIKKHKEYFLKNGIYPPFNAKNNNIDVVPVHNGVLIRQDGKSEQSDSIPRALPLFKMKSYKNQHRYFYYIINQRFQSQIELKIPLENVKINGKSFQNTDVNGIPELSDGDIIDNISLFPNVKFKVLLYKTNYFS